MTKFSELGLAAPILSALSTEGYTTPTPIQAQTIPSAMSGRDVLGIAQTGTGKTAAFSLPILHHLFTHKQRPRPKCCRVLILCPTRELASQIAESMKTYGSHLHLHVVTVFGGVGYGPQIRALAKGVDVLVATPGRLVDHIDSHNVDLGQTEVLVLDEVDQMLDLGFVKAIRRIVRLLPHQRQNLFFSATMPKEIGELAGELLKDPVTVSVTPVATTAERVEQKVYLIEQRRKQDLLVELFQDQALSRTIIFTRTKRGADKVSAHLEKCGIGSSAIHGNKSQGQRERSLADFRAGQVRALVATDIAARGIDIDRVTHVINFDLPEVAESYVHRIGRTARAGAEGQAISLVDSEERGLLKAIEKLTRQEIDVTDRRDPNAQPIGPAIVQPDRRKKGYQPGDGKPAGRSSGAASRGGAQRGDSRGASSRQRPDRSQSDRSQSDFQRDDSRSPRPARPQGQQQQAPKPFKQQDNTPRAARPAEPSNRHSVDALGTRAQPKPFSGKPQSHNTQGQKPQGNQGRPQAANPQGQRPQSSKPHASKPQASKPQGPHAQAARPQGGERPLQRKRAG